MDILLEQGDHSRDNHGLPHTIGGTEQLIQQALLRLSIPKGSFPYDQHLGSQLALLSGLPEHAANRSALSYATEALRALPQIQVLDAQCQHDAPDELTVTVELAINDKNMILEVKY